MDLMMEQLITQIETRYIKIINNFWKMIKEIMLTKIEYILINNKDKKTFTMKCRLKIQQIIRFLKVRSSIKKPKLLMEFK